MNNAIQTTHNLDFLVAPWKLPKWARLLVRLKLIREDDSYPDIKWWLFRIGTCEGQWRATPEAFEILSIVNMQKGNGHLDDVFEWFEFSCKRNKLPLRILRFHNERFKQYLISQRGFKAINDQDLEKTWNNEIPCS